jgi:hypothetical protein
VQIYLLVRGQADRVQRFINDLQAQYLPYENGTLLQLGVREIKLLEVAFPKERLPEVIGMLAPFDNRLQKYCRFFRGLLGLRGPFKLAAKPSYRVVRQGISVMPLGVKEDKMITARIGELDVKREAI